MEFDIKLKETTEYINRLIEESLPEEAGRQQYVIEAMNYSVSAGGKRIRPMIMLEAYRLHGGKNEEDIIPFMAALECIHTYSLVHDDLPAMDNDDYRRGMLTTHKKYGEDFGILAGDGLLNYAYELMLNWLNKQTDVTLIRRGIRAASIIAAKSGVYGMVGGQCLDVYLTNKKMSEDDLSFIFDLKTGALIEAAFMAGAVMAGASAEAVNKMEKCGNLVGVAFQIQDDILDVTGNQEILGKPVLSDEKNNKTTYVTLYGMERAVKAVNDMSVEACEYVRQAGDNQFLIDLIKKLINREK